jgi:asparaginyl-tRNA synthetase
MRDVLAASVHAFFRERGFVWLHTPIITGNDAEGAGMTFRVEAEGGGGEHDSKAFFGQPANLTVSGQLEAEAYAMSLGDVYTFGPTFRAENSHTSRHLSEFWMVEPEMAFADLDDDMDLAEAFLKRLLADALNFGARDLAFFEERVEKGLLSRLTSILDKPFVRMPYTDAVKLLEKSGATFQYPVSWGVDLQSEHERWITEVHVGGPVILTDYPKDIKAFYMRLNDDGKTVRAMDVLVPQVGEIMGGAQREERLAVLEGRMDSAQVSREALDWFLDLRRFGTAPHAGFGLGFERLVQYVTGMQNIRDVIPFPRAPGLLKI